MIHFDGLPIMFCLFGGKRQAQEEDNNVDDESARE